MKRPLVLKLVLAWCGFYSLMQLGAVSLAVNKKPEPDALSAVPPLVAFVLMGYGTIGLCGLKRWAGWCCAATLGLLTLWLPSGYLHVASLPGTDPNRLLVTFSVLAAMNLASIAYLVSPSYRKRCNASDATVQTSN